MLISFEDIDVNELQPNVGIANIKYSNKSMFLVHSQSWSNNFLRAIWKQTPKWLVVFITFQSISMNVESLPS